MCCQAPLASSGLLSREKFQPQSERPLVKEFVHLQPQFLQGDSLLFDLKMLHNVLGTKS